MNSDMIQANMAQLNESQKTMMDSLHTIATTALNALESLTALNLEASKSSIAEAGKQLHQGASVKNPQELMSLQAAMLKPAMENSSAYARAAFAIGNGAATEIAQEIKTRMTHLAEVAKKSAESASGQSFYKSDLSNAALKQIMDSANSLYEQIGQVSQQAIAFTESATAAVSRSSRKAK